MGKVMANFEDRYEMVDGTHDYDPRWDYDVREDLFDHPYQVAAQHRMDELAQRSDTPFLHGHVYPWDSDGKSAAVYCNGTSGEPCVMFDPLLHERMDQEGYGNQSAKTVDHEVRHAMQEHEDPNTDFNEDDAEGYHFSTWTVESDTEKILRNVMTGGPFVPAHLTVIGSSQVEWWEGKPGDAVVMASGGSTEDRWLAEQIVSSQLAAVGYKRAQFTFDAEHKTAGWPDIMTKAKRLVQSGNVTLLRNGWNNIVAHVVGDHGEYNSEIGRDDPESRSITTWQCECPWDQYAWQRTRKWKKYEGRPCAHVLATFWKSQATPLDEAPPEGSNLPPGQKGGEPAPPPSGGGGGAPPGGATPSPIEQPSPAGAAPPGGMAPPGEGPLPTPPMDQMAEQMPPVPGQTPGGMPANPNIVSVPGAKMPSPFNPIQFPGGTYSKTSAEEFAAPEIVRLKNEGYGMAEGKSEEHGAGQYQSIPAGTEGEVLGQDTSTGWVEVIFPLHESSYMEPYHVKMFCEPGEIEHTNKQPPGPFIQRR